MRRTKVFIDGLNALLERLSISDQDLDFLGRVEALAKNAGISDCARGKEIRRCDAYLGRGLTGFHAIRTMNQYFGDFAGGKPSYQSNENSNPLQFVWEVGKTEYIVRLHMQGKSSK
jgi:hypothetical protein